MNIEFCAGNERECCRCQLVKRQHGEGISLSVDKYFYVARPDKDNADTINRKLAEGKNIIFSPEFIVWTSLLRLKS